MADCTLPQAASAYGTPYRAAQDDIMLSDWCLGAVTGGVCRASGEYCEAGELAVKAFDRNPKTKWLEPSGANPLYPAWLEYRLVPDHVGGPAVVSSYSVTSANDHPERDPTAWVLEGVAAVDENKGDMQHVWQILDEQQGVNFPKRFHQLQFPVAFHAPCYRWRLRITNTRVDGAKLQLSCWTLWRAQLGPGNRCSAYLPEQSSLANLLDPPKPTLRPVSNYVWRSSSPLGVSPLASPLGISPARSRSLGANSDWHHPVAVDGDFPAWVEFRVPEDKEPVVLKAYRLVAGRERDRGEDPSWWYVEGVPAAGISSYPPTSAPQAGSPLGGLANPPPWVRLHQVNGYQFTGPQSGHVFHITTALPCWRFRVVFTTPRQLRRGLRLAGMAFYASGESLPAGPELVATRCTPWVLAKDTQVPQRALSKGRLVGGICRASGQHSAVGEVTANAFDGNTHTKWLELEGASEDKPAWIEYSLLPDAPLVKLTSYSVTSANDHPERDPVSWVLEGMVHPEAATREEIEGAHVREWHWLHVVADMRFKDRHQVQTFDPDWCPPCSAFRLRITKTAQPGCPIVQLSCLDLFVQDSNTSTPKAPKQ